MKLCYFKKPNFGDQLNPWLWNLLFPNIFDDDKNISFYGIGTIVSPYPEKPLKHVFGSGYGYSKAPVSSFKNNWIFHFVRGPKTAKVLELPSSLAITDPAILVHSFHQPTDKKYKFAFMPLCYHASSYDFQPICLELGIKYIDPRTTDIFKVMDEISSSEVVIAEAMHGAIVADALRVPWVPIRLTNINLFKWSDWCASIELDYKPIGFFQSFNNSLVNTSLIKLNDWQPLKDFFVKTSLMSVLKNPQSMMSKDAIFKNRLEQVWHQVEAFKKVALVK